KFAGVEQELVGDDPCRPLTAPGEVAISAKIAALIDRLEFDSGVIGAIIVEGGEHQRLTELPVVDKIARAFEKGVDADFKLLLQFLGHARIDVIRPLWPNRT